MTTREELVGPWGFESDETSSGPMFSVYDDLGHRLTEPYIEEGAARLIAAAPDLLAALKRSAEGWANALELDLLPPQHRMAATILRDECRGAITAATGGKHEQD